MPIGEFGRPAEVSPAVTTPMYWMYELAHASLNPARAVTNATKILFQNPLNPFTRTEFGKSVAAGCELFERTTRRYGKPDWGLNDTEVNGVRTPVEIHLVWEKPFCRLLYFDRKLTGPLRAPQPRVLIVAPMSGHYATLLRGTVEAFLPTHDVYITDWSDARMVPLSEGRFDLDDYVDYIIEMLHVLGGNMHVVAVCQPSVPVVAAVSVMEAAGDPYVPVSMTLMGGPIDTRRNPTAVNNLAAEKGIDWFRHHAISKVPFPHPGFMRDVYPGFLQLNGFISMNFDRHMDAHKNLFKDLVKGDRLQLPIREAQLRLQQRCPFFDLVECVPSEASACPAAAAQHSAPVTLHGSIDFYETPEISGDAVIAIVGAQDDVDFTGLVTDLVMPYSPHQLLQRHKAAL
jgi:poly(3-hydroxybutyrate) depolymerase